MPTETERKYPVSADDPRRHTKIRETRTLRQGCLPRPHVRDPDPRHRRHGRVPGQPRSPLRRGPVQPGRHETHHRAPGEGEAPRRGDGPVKGPRDGPAHTEYEYPAPVADALELLGPCGPRALVKHRHTLPDDWTVEEYAPRTQA